MTCPCFSKKNYHECCETYHKGLLPDSALKLMRSRYAAYAKNLSKYIIDTTHPENPHYNSNVEAWEKSISEFCEAFTFTGLDIIDFQEGRVSATVTFVAHIVKDGCDHSFKERSFFEIVGGKWLYLKGEISNN
ncbi:MAG: YchJ family metal-binding protein [Chlamydiales bacterium]